MNQPQPDRCPRDNPEEPAVPPDAMVGHPRDCTCVDCSYRAGIGYYRRTPGRKFDHWRGRAATDASASDETGKPERPSRGY